MNVGTWPRCVRLLTEWGDFKPVGVDSTGKLDCFARGCFDDSRLRYGCPRIQCQKHGIHNDQNGQSCKTVDRTESGWRYPRRRLKQILLDNLPFRHILQARARRARFLSPWWMHGGHGDGTAPNRQKYAQPLEFNPPTYDPEKQEQTNDAGTTRPLVEH